MSTTSPPSNQDFFSKIQTIWSQQTSCWKSKNAENTWDWLLYTLSACWLLLPKRSILNLLRFADFVIVSLERIKFITGQHFLTGKRKKFEFVWISVNVVFYFLCAKLLSGLFKSIYHNSICCWTKKHRDFQKINRGSILALKTSFQIFYCLRLSPFLSEVELQMNIFIDLILVSVSMSTHLWPLSI